MYSGFYVEIRWLAYNDSLSPYTRCVGVWALSLSLWVPYSLIRARVRFTKERAHVHARTRAARARLDLDLPSPPSRIAQGLAWQLPRT